MTDALKAFADRVAHYPVLLFGAVSASIDWRYPKASVAANLAITAWITFLQTLFTSSRKGLEEAKTAARNETIAEVSALDVALPLAPPPPPWAVRPQP